MAAVVQQRPRYRKMPIARRVKSIWRDVDRFLAELDRYHHYLSSHGKCGQGWLLAFRNDLDRKSVVRERVSWMV